MAGSATAVGVLPQVWDLRKFKAPLHVFGGLPNLMSTTGACFSPDDRLAITGTSAGRDGAGATLIFVDLAKEAVVRRIGMPGNVVALNWHSRLNQIFVGTGAPTLSPSIAREPASSVASKACVVTALAGENPFILQALTAIYLECIMCTE